MLTRLNSFSPAVQNQNRIAFGLGSEVTLAGGQITLSISGGAGSKYRVDKITYPAAITEAGNAQGPKDTIEEYLNARTEQFEIEPDPGKEYTTVYNLADGKIKVVTTKDGGLKGIVRPTMDGVGTVLHRFNPNTGGFKDPLTLDQSVGEVAKSFAEIR